MLVIANLSQSVLHLQLMETENKLQYTLRQHGYSLTKPRRVVFEALQSRDTLSMYELILHCEAAIDRATVYRTVALFEQLGIVQRLPIGWKYRLELSDQFSDHHHHATCTHCGTVITLPEDPELEHRLDEIAENHRFRLESHQIEMRGLCESCAKT